MNISIADKEGIIVADNWIYFTTMKACNRMLRALILVFCTSCLGVAHHPMISQSAAAAKVKFSLEEIDEHGLIGPPDGKRSVAYIFYMPAEKKKKREVQRIDPSVRFFERKGGDYQCIGGGGTKDTILRLASLPYIQAIRPFYGE